MREGHGPEGSSARDAGPRALLLEFVAPACGTREKLRNLMSVSRMSRLSVRVKSGWRLLRALVMLSPLWSAW